jgi:hypothetical protein
VAKQQLTRSYKRPAASFQRKPISPILNVLNHHHRPRPRPRPPHPDPDPDPDPHHHHHPRVVIIVFVMCIFIFIYIYNYILYTLLYISGTNKPYTLCTEYIRIALWG